MGRERIFRFKQFEVIHSKCAHKVGVDGVLIGAWANVQQATSILDVGTGCGLIALMCAQRNPVAEIIGIDNDSDSVDEAKYNFSKSLWEERLTALHLNIIDCVKNPDSLNVRKFDNIISNPPYFNSGVRDKSSSRLIARHYGELSPLSLIEIGSEMLIDGGMLSMIFPYIHLEKILEFGRMKGMTAERICNVRGNIGSEYKRSMVEFRFDLSANHDTLYEELTIEKGRGIYTDEYISLCRDYYLKF